jgi:serine/threonine-protein kinase
MVSESCVDSPRIPILVLHFEALSPDSSIQAFANQLPAEIRDRLERQSRRVKPVGLESPFEFLLKGTVAPDGIRLSLESLDLEDDPLLELSFTTVLDPGDQVALVRLAAGIARAIEESVLEVAGAPALREGTLSELASDAYKQGRALWDLRDPRYFETAISRFRDAVMEDPEFALAWAALADAYNLLGAYDYGLLPPDSARRRAREAADRAMALDGDLAQAQAALATTHFFYEWDLRTAETLYESALRLNDRYSHAHHYLALLLAVEGRFQEARERIDQAILVQPSPVLLSARARISYFAERFTRAREGYEEALRADPHHVPALLGLGLSALMDGDPTAAMEAYSRADEQLGGMGLVVFALKGHLLGSRGRTEEARAILQQLGQIEEGGTFVPAEYFTMIHLGLGEFDRALDYLYKAFDYGSNSMTILEVDPLTLPLRDHPRFRALVARVKGERFP